MRDGHAVLRQKQLDVSQAQAEYMIDTLLHVWTAPRMQVKNEKSDGRVDCDHVSGLVDAAR